MIRQYPNGGPSFLVPLVGPKAAQSAAIRKGLNGATPEPAATEPAEAPAPSPSDDFEAVLTELRTTLGSDFDRVLPQGEISALRGNPAGLSAFVRNLRTSRALAKRDQARADVLAAKAAIENDEKEQSRLAGLGRKVGEAEHAARQKDFE